MVGTAAVGTLLAVPLVHYELYPLFAETTSLSWSDLRQKGNYAAITTPERRDVEIKQVYGWRESISKKPVYVTKSKRKPTSTVLRF